MAITGDYPHPVNVNGYSCKNCTDVDYAKKHVDPQHPKSGPFDVNAAIDPTRKADALKAGKTAGSSAASPARIADALVGSKLDLTA